MRTDELIGKLVAGDGDGRGGEAVREAILAGGRYDVAMRVLDLVDGLSDEFHAAGNPDPFTDALSAVSRCLVTARPV